MFKKLLLASAALALAAGAASAKELNAIGVSVGSLGNLYWLFSGSGVLSGRHDGRAAKALGW